MDSIAFRTWAEFKGFVDSFGNSPVKMMSYVERSDRYFIWGVIEGKSIEYLLLFTDSLAKTDFDTNYKPYMNTGNHWDGEGRQAYFTQSGNPDWTTQWITRGDDVAGGKRNHGESTMFSTSEPDNIMDESVALLNSGDGFKLNALNNYRFENQPSVDFYKNKYGVNDVWKRKRIRLQLLDDIEAYELGYSYEGGAYKKIFFHPYIVVNNNDLGGTGMNPDGGYVAAYDGLAAHNKDTNPVCWCVDTYCEEVPFMFSKDKGVFKPERTSKVIPTNSYGNLAELWVEITYNETYFLTNPDCIGYVWAGVYSERNIDKNW